MPGDLASLVTWALSDEPGATVARLTRLLGADEGAVATVLRGAPSEYFTDSEGLRWFAREPRTLDTEWLAREREDRLLEEQTALENHRSQLDLVVVTRYGPLFHRTATCVVLTTEGRRRTSYEHQTWEVSRGTATLDGKTPCEKCVIPRSRNKRR